MQSLPILELATATGASPRTGTSAGARWSRWLLAAWMAGAATAAAEGPPAFALADDASGAQRARSSSLRLPAGITERERMPRLPADGTASAGALAAHTAWWDDTLRAGVRFHPSPAALNAAADNARAGMDDGGVLVEAYTAWRLQDHTLTLGRQAIDRPFIAGRGAPNAFEACTLAGTVAGVRYTGGYLAKEKRPDDDRFVAMSSVVGTPGSAGVAFAGATYAFGNGGRLRVDELYAFDAFSTLYADVRYPLALDGGTRVTLGAQYYPQAAVGDRAAGAFSTWGYGLAAEMERGPLGVNVYWTQNGTGGDTLHPFGEHPSYLGTSPVAFNAAGTRAWSVVAAVDGAPFGVPGHVIDVTYAQSLERGDTTAASADGNDVDASVAIAFTRRFEGAGLTGGLQFARLDAEAPAPGTQVRAYVNWSLRF